MEESWRILLIEDSRTQAELFRRLFEAQGWDVVCADSAESALGELNRDRPDLIVVDYHLPGMRGDEFCSKIRMNVNTRGIPILMLTVEGAEDAETRGLQSGADDYLAKSVDPDILVLRARALLRKSESPAPIPGRSQSFTRTRLLAIDDSPTFLHYLSQELASENYLIERANGGRAGLERVRQQGFDCVLVDLEMPDMDGIEVCHHLTELRRGAGSAMVVVMLTGHEEKKHLARALDAGADDFIGKSCEMPVIKARIRALLRRKSVIEDNRDILEEFKIKELEAVRARAEKEAAELRARLAGQLAQTNRELAEANRKLQDALDVTRAITQYAADALFLLDEEGRVTFMNPAAEEMFGFTREELEGQILHDKIHHHLADGTPLPRSDCAASRALSPGGTIIGREETFFRKDGGPVDVSCSNAPIFREGRAGGTVAVVHDVSERKRAEERLRQSQKLEGIGLLAGGIAHDFNNILTAIIGAAKLIEADVPPKAAGFLQIILDGADNAANLTRQLLAYAGKSRFVIQRLDVPAIVRAMTGLIRLSLPKTTELRFDLPESLPMISGDPAQVQQVVMNLVLNASEAIQSETGGMVTVSAGVEQVVEPFIDDAGAQVERGLYVRLEVTDNGAGIDEQTRARIFDPFFTTKFAGRGLGLAAVCGITRSQKGAITITSAPGQGSTFRVLFPASAG